MKLLFAPLLAFACTVTAATAAAPSAITVASPYSHPTAAPGVPGVGFFTLTNTGSQPDRLLKVESPRAGRVEIHESKMANGVMQMRALGDGLALPSGKPVALAPGGVHLMLFALPQPLKLGEEVPLTLTFERAGPLKTSLKVEPRAAKPAAESEDHSHHGHDH